MTAITIPGDELARRTRIPSMPRWMLRALTIVGAALAAVAVWGVATLVFGLDLHQPAFDASAPQALSPVVVGAVAVVGGLLAWASLALLEGITSRGPSIWLGVALVALLFSISGPLSGHGISGANRFALALMHLAVATVLAPLLYLTSSPAVHPEAR